MTGLAADWSEWASACAERRQSRAGQPVPDSFTMTVLGHDGAQLCAGTVDVATGASTEHLAPVVSLMGRR